MRRLTLALVLCVLIGFIMQTTGPTSAHGATAARFDGTPEADAGRPCAMAFYVDLMQNDLGALDNTPYTVINAIPSAIQFEATLVTLRHKYEDMDVPASCLATKTQVVAYLANYTDLVDLSIALLADNPNAASYNVQLNTQIDRLAAQKLALGKLLPNLS
jgi:hypothetical protein